MPHHFVELGELAETKKLLISRTIRCSAGSNPALHASLFLKEYNMEPSYELKQEYKYYRKAVIASYNKQYIRYFIYSKLGKYYAKKQERK